MSLRQGPQIGAASHDEVTAAGFTLPNLRKPAPAALTVPTLDVEPTGAFSGRTAAEKRAHALQKGAPKGSDTYVQQIKGAWCVVRSKGRVTTYLEG